MKSNDIRRAFTDFFTERGHLNVASSPLVPHNDATVLLTTAGMQQFIPYFLGLEQPPRTRLTSIQKCFRTGDIDEVGDESHLTFFEMLGNFSFGDYFKADAISWAWELLTEKVGVPADRWHPTVHPLDEFSFKYWRDTIGVPTERIGMLEDNWWGPIGATGPNGPDSEIYYDRGPELSCGHPECGPGCDCARFLETWNLVFMEFSRETDGTTVPLPKQNIDTGMGLERLAMILQGAGSVFETDLFLPILEEAAKLVGVQYKQDPQADRALRVIADHARAVTFLIADGVLPGNEGRGYVLRRVLRRAVRHGRLLGIERPFLGEMAEVAIRMFGEHYPELIAQRDRIRRIISHEEERFSRTLAAGIARFEALVEEVRRGGENALPGAEVFRLYATYGFPLELTEELAAEERLTVDRAGFEHALEEERELSRASAGRFAEHGRERSGIYVAVSGEPSEFLGYGGTEADGRVIGILNIEGPVEVAEAGDHVEIVMDRTPFYAESGGQVGDTGTISTDTGVFTVVDTQRPIPRLIVHRGTIKEGFIRAGQTAHAVVDAQRREDIRRNHTATHLLHAALRDVLGKHVRQAGSLVAPDRLRFDFTSLEPVSQAQLREVQALVNNQVILDRPVDVHVKTYPEAMAEGAMALFGEKYGDLVRVINIPGFSVELCGGTHVGHTGDIGLFVLTSESSIASGVRRVEAITGRASIDYALRLHDMAGQLSHLLHVPAEAIPSQVAELSAASREREREIERLRVELAAVQVNELMGQVTTVDGVRLVSARVEAPDRDTLLQLGDRLRDRLVSGIIVLGSAIDGRAALLATVTRDLVPRGLNAGRLIQEIAPVVGGRGGGRPELAQGGGTEVERLDEALTAARGIVERQVSD